MVKQDPLKSKKISKKKYVYHIAALILIVLILALGVYFGFETPSVTGQVTLNEEEFNMLTPFGFNLGMLVVGAMAAIYVVLLISKEGIEK